MPQTKQKRPVKKSPKSHIHGDLHAHHAAQHKSGKSHFKGIIFDIDNVLIDTRASYFEAIRWTIDIYLTHGKVPFYVPSQSTREPIILSKSQVMDFKFLGGFNDDWDCCYGLLVYLLSLKPAQRNTDSLKQKINIRALAKKFKSYPLQVSGIVKELGRPNGVTIEKISRIFQEVYLGAGLFEKLEHLQPFYWKKKGLIYKEKLVFRKSTLEKLRDMGIKLGIATGRPRFEAIYALDQFGILDFFDSITTVNEVKRAEKEMKQSLRKPHPFSILQTANSMKLNDGLLYIGDLPDDILAAKRAKKNIKIKSIAYASASLEPKKTLKEMVQAGADYVLKKPGDITKLVRYPNTYHA